jgi:hypothetical protein
VSAELFASFAKKDEFLIENEESKIVNVRQLYTLALFLPHETLGYPMGSSFWQSSLRLSRNPFSTIRYQYFHEGDAHFRLLRYQACLFHAK